MCSPVLVWVVDTKSAVQIRIIAPGIELITVSHIFWTPGAIKQADLAVILLVFKKVEHNCPDWSHTNAATDKKHIFPLPFMVREKVAQGARRPILSPASTLCRIPSILRRA